MQTLLAAKRLTAGSSEDVEAITRLHAASSGSQLLEFLQSLRLKQQLFFYDELPLLLDNWIIGMSKKGKASQHLPVQFASTEIEARSYKKVDAMAIALGHLKSIYPPALKSVLYRSMLVDKTVGVPKTRLLKFKSNKAWTALQSWTYNRMPKVKDRDTDHTKQIEVVLEVPASKVKKHVVSDYVQLAKLCKDAIAASVKINKAGEKAGLAEAEYYVHCGYWKRLSRTLNSFKDEKEVLMYVPTGTVLKCTWRAYNLDDRGESISQIK